MSRAPYVLGKSARPYPAGSPEVHDSTMGWRFVNPRLNELYGTDAMGETAENLAREYGITRLEQDKFALYSHQKAIRAMAAGRFADELLAVEVTHRACAHLVGEDEGPRRDMSLEALSHLRPVFRQDGTVTAGNASPLNDGASALVIASRTFASEHGLEPLATVRAFATAGVPPRVMGIGPVPATRRALDRARLYLSDVNRIELNEAFAAQCLAVLHDLAVDLYDERLNANGGAIALGPALGSSGGRLMTTLVHELRRSGGGVGLASMRIGVGQGISTLVEVA